MHSPIMEVLAKFGDWVAPDDNVDFQSHIAVLEYIYVPNFYHIVWRPVTAMAI